MLAAGKGTQVDIETIGDQEQEALDALVALFASRFGEES
jgi:phosphocarrier protein